MNAVPRHGGEGVELVINWGLGVDSTTYMVKMLEDPAAHGVDLARTVVLHELTGDEWPATRAMRSSTCCCSFASTGSGSFKSPGRAGRWRSWSWTTPASPSGSSNADPGRCGTSGTVPQQGGIRLCSLHAKGEVGDAWIDQEIGDRPFRQVMGFNAAGTRPRARTRCARACTP